MSVEQQRPSHGVKVDPRLRLDLEAAIGRPLSPLDYAVAVLRISTDEKMQASLPDQENMCRELAGWLGVPLSRSVTDKMSRSLWPRPAAAEALLDAKDPHCVAILTWESSRFMGDEEQVIMISRVLQDTRTAFASYRKRKVFDARNRIELLMEIITGWNSGTEVENLRARVWETHMQKFDGGRFIQRPPYGVDVAEDGTVTENQNQMEVLRRVWHWVVDEGLTIYAVVERLNALGIRTKPTRRDPEGVEWSKANTSRVLTNRFYLGEMTWNKRQWIRQGDKKIRVMRAESEWVTKPSPLGNIVARPHDCSGDGCQACAAAVTLFEQAERIIMSRKREHRPKGSNPKLNRLFGTLIYCGRCGNRMYVIREAERITNGKRRYERFSYACKAKYAGRCARSHSVGERTIMRNLEAWLKGLSEVAYIGTPNYTVSVADRPGTARQRALLTKSLKEIADERKGYLRMRAKSELDDSEFVEMNADLSTRLLVVEEQLDELNRIEGTSMEDEIVGLREVLAQLYDYFLDEDIAIEKRQARLATLVERVVVDHPNVTFELRSA